MPARNPFNPDWTNEGASVTKWHEQKARTARETRETLELLNAGWSHRSVAEKHGVGLKTVAARYKKALKQYLPEQEVVQARKAFLDRLDALTRSDLEMLARAKREGNIDAYAKLHACLMAAEDRRIEVMGLQAPKTLVVQQPDLQATPQETELQGLLAQAREANEAKLAAMGAPAADDTEESAA